MPKALKRALVVVGVVLLAIVLVVGGYVAYLMLTYNRIADGVEVEVENNPQTLLAHDGEYSVATYNIGFGAYTPDYTFFMDEGIMADGTKTVGEHATAVSEDSVVACTEGAIDVLEGLDLDFAMLQEVDTDSTRSYQVNQKAALEKAFPALSSAFAVNFHSAFLAYPLTDMHGIVNAGLLTLGDAHVDSAVRRSYPVDDGFPTKFFDLDRCFLVERLPIAGTGGTGEAGDGGTGDGGASGTGDGGGDGAGGGSDRAGASEGDSDRELVLINSHMSAYDEGGLIRAQQLELLKGVLAEEAAKGNYVIVGGDWNHALSGSVDLYESAQQIPPWVSTFDESELPSGFSVVRPDNLEQVASCRGDDIPYEEGVTYRVTVDGFIVSDNVNATAEIVDTGFAYSDHNPVKLTFTLE